MAATPAAIERAFGVTNIKSHIPIILDLNDHNYDAWRDLFLTHCLTFDVLGHVDGTLLPTGNNDVAWKKRDGLVKLWLYGTLAQPLFRSSFKTGGTARDIWLRIENQFRNNKEARAIQLDNELRTTEIGDQSIQEYCQKLKSLADLLTNVDAPVSERTLVMYLLNGLNEKYDFIINVIKHKEPFPSFDSAKSMLEMEESRLMKSHKLPSAIHSDHSSSSSALIVSHQHEKNSSSVNEQKQVKFNNFRGNKKNNNRYRGRNNNQANGGPNYGGFNGPNYGGGFNGGPNYPYWPSPNFWNGPPPPWPNQFANWTPQQQMPTYRGPPPRQMNNTQQAHLVEIQPTGYTQAYTTETLQDPNNADWYMDSGATAHLSATTGSSHSDNSSPV